VRLGLILIPLAWLVMLLILIFVWDEAYIRGLIIAWLVIVASSAPFMLLWFLPRIRAMFRLPPHWYADVI